MPRSLEDKFEARLQIADDGRITSAVPDTINGISSQKTTQGGLRVDTDTTGQVEIDWIGENPKRLHIMYRMIKDRELLKKDMRPDKGEGAKKKEGK